MLDYVTIENLVLIDKLSLSFEKGLSVLTGETGAGKSIILDALGLVLGQRADVKLIRHGQEKALVTAAFSDFSPEFLSFFQEACEEVGLEIDLSNQESLVIRRILRVDGRSQSFVNDQPVSLAFLKLVSDGLLEIIGQFQTQSLMDLSQHLVSLDLFGGLASDVQEVRALFTAWKEAEKAYEQLFLEIEKSQREQEYIQHALTELTDLNIAENEEETLLEKRQAFMNAQKIREVTEQLESVFNGDASPKSDILKALRLIDRQPSYIRDMYAAVYDALNRASIELVEAEGQLSSASADDLSEADFEALEERLSLIRTLARKYQVASVDLIAKRDYFAQEIALISDGEAMLSQQKKKFETSKKAYLEKAEILHAKRADIAQKLQVRVNAELAPLKMGHAQFSVAVEVLSEEKATFSGLSSVQFLINTGSSGVLSPIHKVASGGELSRLMLALKLVLHQSEGAMTLIFDEIDTGIGGAVSDAVGERLKALSKEKQIFLVTHSPQIASRADHHYFVQKDKKEHSELFTSSVVTLSYEQRVEELARMISGAHVSEEARAAARTLIAA